MKKILILVCAMIIWIITINSIKESEKDIFGDNFKKIDRYDIFV